MECGSGFSREIVLAGQAQRGFRSPFAIPLCPIACFLLRKKFPARFAFPRSLDTQSLRSFKRLALHEEKLQCSADSTGKPSS
jgi:hypothetical protein